MGVKFQKAHGPWTLSSAHGRAMSQSSADIIVKAPLSFVSFYNLTIDYNNERMIGLLTSEDTAFETKL
ncbi:hypothetical protein ACN38_g12018 [Penicillium nordicum]|uniref:Uncharacterized protein n=1 Tax=Penicillium nordicum TaxID=229535 RepID=A0A0M8NQA4_9EURO|nr:hypothetical protein ACN38_g12018 [Penicillium nordicum]